MKRQGKTSMKLRRLARALGCGRPAAIGYLELLWLFTSEEAPAGDVGRWTNEEIAEACDWDQEPQIFIDALLRTGWLDHDAPASEHRLLVHDWPQHCDTHVHRKLIRAFQHFADGTTPRISEGTERERRAWAEHFANAPSGSGGRPEAPSAQGPAAGAATPPDPIPDQAETGGRIDPGEAPNGDSSPPPVGDDHTEDRGETGKGSRGDLGGDPAGVVPDPTIPDPERESTQPPGEAAPPGAPDPPASAGALSLSIEDLARRLRPSNPSQVMRWIPLNLARAQHSALLRLAIEGVRMPTQHQLEAALVDRLHAFLNAEDGRSAPLRTAGPDGTLARIRADQEQSLQRLYEEGDIEAPTLKAFRAAQVRWRNEGRLGGGA